MKKIVGDIDNQSLKKEIENSKDVLMESDMQNMRQRVFKYAKEILDANILNQELDRVIKKLKCVADQKVPFGSVLKIVEDGICQFYYPHQNNTLMERSKFVANKEVVVEIKKKFG